MQIFFMENRLELSDIEFNVATRITSELFGVKRDLDMIWDENFYFQFFIV